MKLYNVKRSTLITRGTKYPSTVLLVKMADQVKNVLQRMRVTPLTPPPLRTAYRHFWPRILRTPFNNKKTPTILGVSIYIKKENK